MLFLGTEQMETASLSCGSELEALFQAWIVLGLQKQLHIEESS